MIYCLFPCHKSHRNRINSAVCQESWCFCCHFFPGGCCYGNRSLNPNLRMVAWAMVPMNTSVLWKMMGWAVFMCLNVGQGSVTFNEPWCICLKNEASPDSTCWLWRSVMSNKFMFLSSSNSVHFLYFCQLQQLRIKLRHLCLILSEKQNYFSTKPQFISSLICSGFVLLLHCSVL